MESQDEFMKMALAEAEKAALRDEVPVGAVIVHDGVVIAAAGNRVEELHDPCAHAELLAIRAAGAVFNAPRLVDCDLYVTLEPCAMCAAGISFARIRHVYYGAADPKGGGVDHGGKFYSQKTCHHRPTVTSGIMAEPCGQTLKDFFAGKRKG